MYSLYTKSVSEGMEEYKVKKHRECLFGCKNGYIPWLLGKHLPDGNTWHLDIGKQLNEVEGYERCCLIINLKPNNNPPNLSLYELADVWGYSHDKWTPIMLRMRSLCMDNKPRIVNPEHFERATKEIIDPIFSFLYLNGSIENGELIGKWTAPRSSPTNSALLWPDVLEHFAKVAKEVQNGQKGDCING